MQKRKNLHLNRIASEAEKLLIFAARKKIYFRQKKSRHALQRAVLEQSVSLGFLLFLVAKAARACHTQLLVAVVVVAIGA